MSEPSTPFTKWMMVYNLCLKQCARHLNGKTHRLVFVVAASASIAFRCQCLCLVEFSNLKRNHIKVNFRSRGNVYRLELTCSDVVASSASLSSLILMNLGKRKEIPLSSTCADQGVSQGVCNTVHRIRSYQTLGRHIDRTQRQIGREHLENDFWFKPYIRWFRHVCLNVASFP